VADVNRRLSKLESGRTGCERCAGEPIQGEPVEYDVYWDDEITDEEIDEKLGPKHCPNCGRELYVTVYWSDWGRGGE
jgi:hypothetical protein